jgi:peptidoglycan/LPS O-acetylase OafA/YrhL
MERLNPASDRSLSFLSFAALIWVAVNQFRDHPIAGLGNHVGLVAKGYLGADLFLILLAFVLTRWWLDFRPANGVGFASFVWRRMALNYPLHLAAIAAMGLIWLAGTLLGVSFDKTPFNLSALPANLLLIHAWGVLPTVYWNFPSWLLSAELLGVLLLPLFAWAARALSPWLIVLAAVGLFEIAFSIAATRGVLFTDMTAQIGALKIFPDFLFGAGLYAMSRSAGIAPRAGAALAGAGFFWIVAGASSRLSDMLIWPTFGLLVLGLAEAGKSDRIALHWPPLLYAGGIAYAVYLTYLPVDIVYFRTLHSLIGPLLGAKAWIALLGVFPAILIVGAIAHHLVEQPISGFLQQNLISNDSAATLDPRRWLGPRATKR